MTTDTDTAVTTQVYRVYIKATPEAIWDAITKPEWNERYGYPGRSDTATRGGPSTTCARAAATASRPTSGSRQWECRSCSSRAR